MTACVIMHNMIIENERGKDLDYNFYHLMGIPVNPMRKEQRIIRFTKVYSEIRDTDVHDQLQKDLMEELEMTWRKSCIDSLFVCEKLCCIVQNYVVFVLHLISWI